MLKAQTRVQSIGELQLLGMSRPTDNIIVEYV
jgi:hypothetical protein